MADYYTLLTNAGIAYETACKAAGVPIKLTQISVGDGGGSVYNPAATATALKREVWRGPLNALFQDEKNPSWLLAEVTIPPDVGGWYVREAGLWTDTGVLYAIVKYPESFKPVLATSGSGKEFYIRSIFETSNASLVTLLIDDTVVKATRAWVADFVADELAKLDRKQSARATTTANIVLSGAQTIDGRALVAGDRCLVKNQASAAENGLYIVANSAWTRATDANSNTKVTPNMIVAVEEGSTQADTIWQLVTDGAILLGTTSLTFQNVTAGFARLLSPAFAGNPTAPTPLKFDISSRLATTEFVQHALGNYSDVSIFSSSATLEAAYFGRLLLLNGGSPITIKLPPSASGVNGATINFRNVGGAPATIVVSGSDRIGTSATIALPSIVVSPGSSLDLVLQGISYFASGTSVLKFSSDFSSSTGETGFTKQPSGMIEQWGTGVTNADGYVYITFPVAFPTAMRNISILHVGSLSVMTCLVVGSATPTACTVRLQLDDRVTSASWSIQWRALGV